MGGGVKIRKFFDEDPGSGMKTVRIRDPGWKKVGSGIRDKHPGFATLLPTKKTNDKIGKINYHRYQLTTVWRNFSFTLYYLVVTNDTDEAARNPTPKEGSEIKGGCLRNTTEKQLG